MKSYIDLYLFNLLSSLQSWRSDIKIALLHQFRIKLAFWFSSKMAEIYWSYLLMPFQYCLAQKNLYPGHTELRLYCDLRRP